jgi:hypothetical protein
MHVQPRQRRPGGRGWRDERTTAVEHGRKDIAHVGVVLHNEDTQAAKVEGRLPAQNSPLRERLQTLRPVGAYRLPAG